MTAVLSTYILRDKQELNAKGQCSLLSADQHAELADLDPGRVLSYLEVLR